MENHKIKAFHVLIKNLEEQIIEEQKQCDHNWSESMHTNYWKIKKICQICGAVGLYEKNRENDLQFLYGSNDNIKEKESFLTSTFAGRR